MIKAFFDEFKNINPNHLIQVINNSIGYNLLDNKNGNASYASSDKSKQKCYLYDIKYEEQPFSAYGVWKISWNKFEYGVEGNKQILFNQNVIIYPFDISSYTDIDFIHCKDALKKFIAYACPHYLEAKIENKLTKISSKKTTDENKNI